MMSVMTVLASMFAVIVFIDPTATMAERGVKRQQQENNNNQRRLFGERIRGNGRGGAAGAEKNFQESIPMRMRIVPPTPTPAPVPTTPAPVAPTAPPTAAEIGGCRFEGEDGTVTEFEEGASMGSFRQLTDCFNGTPDNYPCFCSSTSPDQTVCPYCTYTDFLERTVCGRDGTTQEFIEFEADELVSCTCDVDVSEVDGLFTVDISSTCVPIPIQAPPQDNITETPTTATVTGTPTEPVATTSVPTGAPTSAQTSAPTVAPVGAPAPTGSETTSSPTAGTVTSNSTFVMGRLNKEENNLLLSEGLSSKLIAKAGEQVIYDSGALSAALFHTNSSGAETFADTRANNPGGWIYLCGKDATEGGVGSITFNAEGEIIDYGMIVTDTGSNRGSGRTPWDTFISGERNLTDRDGDIIQVDPFGERNPSAINMTEVGGAWGGGFAYDNRNPLFPRFFAAEDIGLGPLRRFIPSSVSSSDPWMTLEGEGRTRYLVLTPTNEAGTEGTFSWTANLLLARANAALYYPEAAGLDVQGSTLSFVCRGVRKLFQLDLDEATYKSTSTTFTDLMEGEPNELRYIDGSDGPMIWMTEANGKRSGVHVLNEQMQLFTVIEGYYLPLTAGFALSPNGEHMYVSFSRDGLLFDITRDDGLSFLDNKLYDTEIMVSKRDDN